jgi:putative Mn2+ efflux pump MntP
MRCMARTSLGRRVYARHLGRLRLELPPVFDEDAAILARIVAFVLPLGLDTLAIAIALGLQGQPPLRPALLFVVFETTMPLIGIIIGRLIGLWFETPAAYLGGLILLAVGLHAMREAWNQNNEGQCLSLGSLRGMIVAGFGISMDEIAIGFPLGAQRLPIAAVLGAIAIQTFLVTAGGILVGRKISQKLGMHTSRLAGIAAGAAFFLLGTYLILERLSFRYL